MRMENGEEGWKRRVNEDGREDINGRIAWVDKDEREVVRGGKEEEERAGGKRKGKGDENEGESEWKS